MTLTNVLATRRPPVKGFAAVLLCVGLAGCATSDQEARAMKKQLDQDNSGTSAAIQNFDKVLSGKPGQDASPPAKAFYARQQAAADAYTRRNQAAAASWQRQQQPQNTKGEAQ